MYTPRASFATIPSMSRSQTAWNSAVLVALPEAPRAF
jgi:hypothetical protein